MSQALKQKIRNELHNPNFPNLDFLFSSEVLDLALDFLRELLAEEKADFEQKISKKYVGLDENVRGTLVDTQESGKTVQVQDLPLQQANLWEELSFETFEDFSELDYFFSLLEHYQGVHNDEKIREIIETFEPEYIDFGNEVAYNKRLYEMYKYFYDNVLSQHLTLNLSGEEREQATAQQRIIEKTLKAYEVRGISLPEEKQQRLKEISKELSELSQKFANNLLDDRAQFEYIITDEEKISEMPEDDKTIAREKAQKNDKSGFLFDASASSHSAIMKYCFDAEIRKYFYEARIQFASSGKYDNREIILKILKLREEKAKILGYNNYAELSLVFKMAESPEQVKQLFGEISQKARPKAQQELEEIKNHFSLDILQAWDSAYYSRKLREEKYKLDEKELKKYFVFENVRDALFETVKRLYGIEMKEITPFSPHPTPLPLGEGTNPNLQPHLLPMGEELRGGQVENYSQNIQIYEVYKDGTFLSYFFTDYFYNPLKRQGAWADLLREKYSPPAPLQEKEVKKIVVNVCNFQKNTEGKTLLTLDEVETMYHEFGHAIHEMLSFSPYSELSGFNVEWDFVELPSQLLENWARDEVGMKLFARHFETNSEIPVEMLQRLAELETFGNGNFVLKQNEFAMLDMRLHSEKVPKTIEDLQKISDEVYLQNSLFPPSESYKHYASFSHIFDGGYAAGYYSYMWAEIIEKEVWNVFKNSGDIFDREIAESFYKHILGAGTTKKASELFRDFLARDPQIDAFLREKGLV